MIRSTTSDKSNPNRLNNEGKARRTEITIIYNTDEMPYFFNDVIFLKRIIRMPIEKSRLVNFKAIPAGFISIH